MIVSMQRRYRSSLTSNVSMSTKFSMATAKMIKLNFTSGSRHICSKCKYNLEDGSVKKIILRKIDKLFDWV